MKYRGIYWVLMYVREMGGVLTSDMGIDITGWLFMGEGNLFIWIGNIANRGLNFLYCMGIAYLSNHRLFYLRSSSSS